MSAYLVEPDHIRYLVAAAMPGGLAPDGLCLLGLTGVKGAAGPLQGNDHEVLCRMLHEENVRSLEARYEGRYETEEWVEGEPWCGLIDPVQVLQSIACYEYQACEHEGWASSVAKAFCEGLRSRAISALPGYANAVWGAPERSGRVFRGLRR